MLEICRVFGGTADLERAEAIEKAMEICDLEVGDDLIETVLQVAAQNGQVDYVGYLVDYCTNAIASDFEEAIEEAGLGEFIVDRYSYGNYLASSGEITIDLDAEELAEAGSEEVKELERGLREPYEFYTDLLHEASITVEVRVGDYKADIEEFLSLLSQMPEGEEERKKFMQEKGLIEET